MPDNTKEYDIGAGRVYWKGPGDSTETELGDTQGGIKVTAKMETTEIEVDQYLDPVDEIITKRTITVEAPLAEFTLENLALAFPGSELVTNGTKTKLVLGSTAGASMMSYAGQLRIHPLSLVDTDKSKDFLFPCAAPLGDSLEITYDKTGLKLVNVRFKAYPSQAQATLGQTVVIGDPTAS
ncbi:MAG: hypothetical protein IJ822_09500 [Pyramidobacter sp.]|nr:hypothetical protein [Pyramidobacter sp.]